MAKRYSKKAATRLSKVSKQVATAQPGYNVGGTRPKPKVAKPTKTRVSVRPKSPVAVALYQASQAPTKASAAVRKAGQGVSASINTQRKQILAAGKKARKEFVRRTGLQIR